MILAEVVDSPESAKEFLELNKIKQEEIKAIIVMWEEIKE